MSDELLISLRDVRAQGWCCAGARAFCKQHDIDWKALRTEGVPASVLAATGDAFALKIIEEKTRGR